MGTKTGSKPRRSVVGLLLGLLLKVVLTAVTVAIPLLGVWVASSLAVYLDGPLWLAITAGALLALVLPLLWELWGEARRKKKKKGGERILATFDRLVLRTLALNLAFLAVVLFAYPRQGFAALSTRGDWMLGDSHGATAESVRGVLFDVAGGLEWLYDSATSNPYEQYADTGTGTTPSPAPQVEPTARPAAGYALGSSGHRWPLQESVASVVAGMPSSAKGSVEAVGKYIAGQVSDPFLRVKALHDFAAEWLAYDADALVSGNIPSQRAADVFAARKAVCAGYARLLVALGEVTGDRFVYVTGHSRTSGNDLDGVGHAWNAVEIDGAWYLIDATWDAGFVNGDTFTKRYSSDYLFTPPSVFARDHFPDDAAWQLLATPLTRGDFLRQPALSPSFFARGLSLDAPARSQVDVAGALDLVIENPTGTWIMAVAEDKSSGANVKCAGPVNDAKTALHCAFPADGRYQVQLMVGDQQYGKYRSVGYVEANSDT
ncbi:MAG: transglutaminase [Deltaproteobacteria bacterium]|nr:MAG: transglutaminase [Deltaproteobacteria bacterium]